MIEYEKYYKKGGSYLIPKEIFDELLEENQKYKEIIDKAIEYIKEFDIQRLHECMEHNLVEVLEVLLDILKEVE